jgi:hypothetical protein
MTVTSRIPQLQLEGIDMMVDECDPIHEILGVLCRATVYRVKRLFTRRRKPSASAAEINDLVAMTLRDLGPARFTQIAENLGYSRTMDKWFGPRILHCSQPQSTVQVQDGPNRCE